MVAFKKIRLLFLCGIFLISPYFTDAETQKRKYKIRDLQDAKMAMKENPKKAKSLWFKKLERFIWVAGTLTLVLWVPGSSLRYSDTGGGTNIKINSKPDSGS